MTKEQFRVALAICAVVLAICTVALTGTYVWTELTDTTGRYQFSGATVIDTTSGTIYNTQGAFRDRSPELNPIGPAVPLGPFGNGGEIRAAPLTPYFYDIGVGMDGHTNSGYYRQPRWR